jgi:hypothetical protein
MIIYKTINLINGKFYVGKDERNKPDYLGSGINLQRAIKKYGKENFIKEILEVCSTREELIEKEKYWIKETKAQELGYNIAYGGGGQPYSVITVKGNPWTWLLENPSNTFRFRITAGGSDVNVADISTHLLNTWYNVVGSYDGSNMKIYVNGVLKNTVAQTGTLATNAVTAKIGTFQGTNYNLTGRVSNISIYNRALTATEVQQNFNATRSRFGI